MLYLLPFRLSLGDSTLKPPLLAFYQQVVCIRTYSGHGKGTQATDSLSFSSFIPQDMCAFNIFITFLKIFYFITLAKVLNAVTKLPHPEKPDKAHKKFRMSAQAGWRQWSGSKWVVQGVIIGQNEMQEGLLVEPCLYPCVILQITVREQTMNSWTQLRAACEMTTWTHSCGNIKQRLFHPCSLF